MKPADYVVAIKGINDIPVNAVGIITEINGNDISVSFADVENVVVTDNAHVAFLDISKTGKGYDKKVCNVCHLLKETKEFDVNQTDAKGMKTTRPSCKTCRMKIDGTKLSSAEKKKLDEVAPLGFYKCEICGKTGIAGVTAKYVRDHDHATGKGRGWICDSCNTGLGRFKDSPDLLQKAIDYLKKHS